MCCFEHVFSQHVNPFALIVKAKTDSLSFEFLQNKIAKTNQKSAASFRKAVKQFLPFANQYSQGSSKIFSKYYILTLQDSTKTEIVYKMLNTVNEISVVKSYFYHIDQVRNDSAYLSQWNLERIGMKRLAEEGILNSSLPKIKVGIIDTGVESEHPDLKNSLAQNSGEMGLDSNGFDKRINNIDDDHNGFIDDWQGYDFVDSNGKDGVDWQNRDNLPNDENGHGTSVAGIIGAQENNFIGIAGFGPVSILPLRAFSASGIGSDIDIASAIIYASDNGAEVINMSFGDVVISQILKDAIDYAYSKNVVLVASSGNDGSSNPHYPSDLNEVISVGSVGRYNSRSIFSSYGNSLDVMAPGEFIPTTTLKSSYSQNFSGTSAAAPHVSGAIALLKSLERVNRKSFAKLSNDDWRGIVTTCADDIGAKGWDVETGAGILDVYTASKALFSNTIAILSPKVDEVVDSICVIRISALSSYFSSYSLFIGKGINPVEWNLLVSSNKQCSDDSVITINAKDYESTNYVLRLIVNNSKNNSEESRTRFTINNNSPKILAFSLQDSVVIDNEFASLITATTDIRTTAELLYRRKGSSEKFNLLRSTEIGNTHSFLLTSTFFAPYTEYEFFTKFKSYSSSGKETIFPTIADNGFQYFSVNLPLQKFPSTGFEKQTYALPAGYILPDSVRINEKEVAILNQYTKDKSFGTLKLYEFINGNFIQRDSLSRQWIPKSFIRNENGLPLLLVQDYGTSAIFSIDSVTLKFSKLPLWIDTNNVWGSLLADLNGDKKPELLARNSTEILIFQNSGEEHFTLQTQLQNTSAPLFGEEKNQFGPPKILVGDFTNSGLKEIVVADYDGDLLLYRQTAYYSLSFSLAWIDSSDFLEMSDFISSGDLTGDGIPDIAIAAHSNVDVNSYGEYDFPLWNVRVFSHKNTDVAGSISLLWQQTFAGVHFGLKNNNGIRIGLRSPKTNLPQLLLCLNPNIYILDFQSAEKFRWYAKGASNSFFTFSGLGFDNGSEIEFWKQHSSVSSTVPWAVASKTLDSTKVKITWNSFGNTHNIYRGETDSTLTFLMQVSANEIIDSLLTKNKKYFYAVTVVDSVSGETDFSEIVSAIPHSQAKIVALSQNSPNQLLITFSQDVDKNSLSTAFIELDAVIRSSSAVYVNAVSVLFAFHQAITPGIHSIKIRHLVDATFLLADSSVEFLFSATMPKAKNFIAQQVQMLSPNTIQIEFNTSLNVAHALEKENYHVTTVARAYAIEKVSFDSTQPNKIILYTSTKDRLNDLALRIEITLSNAILSSSGDSLNEGKGQTLSIAQEIETLDNVTVFPNPVRMFSASNKKISFVNTPKNCKIYIFSLSGSCVKILDDVTTSEGVGWNLRDENGNFLPSGIYLYRIEQRDENSKILQTKLGKFAIVQ